MNYENDLKNTKKMNIKDATLEELEAEIKKRKIELTDFIIWNIGKFKDTMDYHWKQTGYFQNIHVFNLYCSKKEPTKIFLEDLLQDKIFEVISIGEGHKLATKLNKEND